ncbi:Aste57867_10777 [Aphanomyces stellatus]|uniref:Aste57867_10777 protein n=1 Tax=Aphanomyces stellatus TaxID=120398 RepID=A0A485KRA8_9STRA|nr:hypothetical protein As57867_010737 [Aphanomyces stellatus]VFT87647.1 Aste57867_10777 [Aphanomyces stellatus]
MRGILGRSKTAPSSSALHPDFDHHAVAGEHVPLHKSQPIAPCMHVNTHRQARLEALHLQAMWQLLVTGFEITKYPRNGKARIRVIWLTLDGRLCVANAKLLKYAVNGVNLWDIDGFEKGCRASQFNQPTSWQGTRNREKSCFSVVVNHHHRFALQVMSDNVRNLLVDNLNIFLRRMRGDGDSESPKILRIKIAKHFANTGDVITVDDMRHEMERQGSDMRQLTQPPSSMVCGGDDLPSDDDDDDDA